MAKKTDWIDDGWFTPAFGGHCHSRVWWGSKHNRQVLAYVVAHHRGVVTKWHAYAKGPDDLGAAPLFMESPIGFPSSRAAKVKATAMAKELMWILEVLHGKQ